MLKSTLAKMAANALDKALKPSNIIYGFKATGMILFISFFKYTKLFARNINQPLFKDVHGKFLLYLTSSITCN